jgi:chemotaxis protein CheD
MSFAGSRSRIAEKHNKILPKCLNGFEHINRFWDKTHDCFAAKILPGEFYVSVHGELIGTVLGSCVSACIRDPKAGIGGMNHFMLPMNKNESRSKILKDSDAARYGNFAMEILINEILKAGGKRRNLEIKLFGGGKVLSNMKTLNIGNKNIEFVRSYLYDEGLHVMAEDLGGLYPRKVLYMAATGKVKMKKLTTSHNNTVIRREAEYSRHLQVDKQSGDVELF